MKKKKKSNLILDTLTKDIYVILVMTTFFLYKNSHSFLGSYMRANNHYYDHES